jgi:hypothetical protein
MAPRVQTMAHELIDHFGTAGHADLVRQDTSPLPVRVLLACVGLPGNHAAFMKPWCHHHIWLAAPGMSAAHQRQSARTEVAFSRYAEPLMAERRRHPQADLLSALMHAEVEGERPWMIVSVGSPQTRRLPHLWEAASSGRTTGTLCRTKAVPPATSATAPWMPSAANQSAFTARMG